MRSAPTRESVASLIFQAAGRKLPVFSSRPPAVLPFFARFASYPDAHPRSPRTPRPAGARSQA